VSLLGAVVMPHNLYLHSGLVLSRDVPRRASAVRRALSYNTIESAAALGLTLLINAAVVCVGAAIVADPATSPELLAGLLASPLQAAPALLRRTLGAGANTFFALALLASGQSSTITGVYAGQFVMDGFLEIHLPPAWRAAATRAVAIVPALAAALLAGAQGAERLIVGCSVLLSVQLPFALIPMIKLCASPAVMGPHAAPPVLTRAAWALTALIVSANSFVVVRVLARPAMVASEVSALSCACVAQVTTAAGSVRSARGGALLGCGTTAALAVYGGALLHLVRRPVSQHGRYGDKAAAQSPATALPEERIALLDPLPQ
jgi:manganese transport protein